MTRALLAHGRTYEAAVKTFEPYKEIQQPNERARQAMTQLGRRAIKRKEPAFLFVNNRLEGYAPGTIESVMDSM